MNLGIAYNTFNKHGRKKIMTLMTFYNGPAAVILGNSVAVLMMFLFAFGGLPGWYLIVPGFRGFACWSLCSGFLVTSLVMLFWRPQTPVFLDRICISSDCKLKTLASNPQLGWAGEKVRLHAHCLGSYVDREVVVLIWTCRFLEKQERFETGLDH